MHSVITSVTVEADGPDHLLIGWALEGPDHGVEVAVGPRPDRIDHGGSVVVAPGPRSLRVARPASTRVYVSVAAAGAGSGLVAAERRVPPSKGPSTSVISAAT